MKILYLSCHEILEFDEVSILTELGHEVFSPEGAYMNPQSGGGKRPAIPNAQYNDHLSSVALQCSRANLHPILIDWADIIIYMHITGENWIKSNWSKTKHKPNIFRSIGQNTRHVEKELAPLVMEGLKIIRYSPNEESIPEYCGSDALIRFYKSPEEFRGWTGEETSVLNVSQSMKSRDRFLNFNLFEEVTSSFPRRILGPGNENFGEQWGGLVDYDSLKDHYRKHRAYFYTGTQPASYTLNFIEAWMTGTPIVAIGPKHANSIFPEQKTYEIPDLITNEVDGFWSDDPQKLKDYISILLNDYSVAKQIGEAGRKRAIEVFSKEVVKEQWRSYLSQFEKK